MSQRIRTIVSWVLVVPIAALFIVAGAGKLTGAATEMFAEWGYAPWFATLIGVLEVLGGIGLLIPRLTKWAIAGLLIIMAGAAYTHVANGEAMEVIRPAIFAAVMVGVWFLRRPSSKPSGA